jgi:hypothetical protein
MLTKAELVGEQIITKFEARKTQLYGRGNQDKKLICKCLIKYQFS